MVLLELTQEREHIQMPFVVVGHLDESWNKATDGKCRLALHQQSWKAAALWW